MTDQKESRRVIRAFALVTSIGIQLAASIVLGFYGGRFLDHWLGTDPWLMVVGLLLGIAAGIWGIYHMVNSVWKG